MSIIQQGCTSAQCCEPQLLSINNTTGVLTISDGNSVNLSTTINNVGFKTPVIDFYLDGDILTLVYVAADGSIQMKLVDLTTLLSGGITVSNTQTVDLTLGAGNLTADVNVSAVPLNAIQIRSDGLFVPTSTQTPITAINTSTVLLSASGPFNTTLSAQVPISATAGNQIQVLGDGLFVPDNSDTILAGTGITIVQSGNTITISANPTNQVPISVNDSSTIHFNSSGSFGTTITGNVKISAAAGNEIIANADGIYAPASSMTQFTCADARACFSAIGPITLDPTTGVISITQATSVTDGYLSSVDWNTFNNKISTGQSLGTGLPVYNGQSGTVLTFNSIAAGPNIGITLAGNTLTIASTVTPGPETFVLEFIVGDGGVYTPTNGATTFSPTGNPLAGSTILGFWIEGLKVAGVPRTGTYVYYTFTQTTGAVVLTNGTFTTGSYYSFIYTI